MSRSTFFVGACLLLGSGLASATTSFGLCGTGFTNTSCTVQGTEGSSVDANWVLSVSSVVQTNDITEPFATVPNAWVAGSAGSTGGQWDAPGPNETSASTTNGAGPFDYTETFTITAGEILSTAQITGNFASDNGSTLTLNGHTIATLPAVGSFGALTAFTITDTGADAGFFQLGTNTLEVAVSNSVNTPTGVIVEITTDNINTAPEPASSWLIGFGFASIGIIGRRLRS